MPGVKPGTSAPSTKKKVPKVIHPLATPGYIIIFRFISACVLNILGFVLTYTCLIIAIPISLLAKAVQNIVVFARIKYQSAKAEYSSASETFWYLTAHNDQTPNLVLLLAVKGHVSCEKVECLLQNRLSGGNSEGHIEEKANFKRLFRTPKWVFRELVWIENNAECRKTVIQADLDNTCLFTAEGKAINLHGFSNGNEWQVYLYSSNGNFEDNTSSIIVLQFRHCIADLHTLIYAVSKSFLDRQVFIFREEISPTQGFCLGLMALLAGPSIFAKTLLKSKDLTFTQPPSTCRKRAIFYSEAISRSDVDIVTTATGTSGKSCMDLLFTSQEIKCLLLYELCTQGRIVLLNALYLNCLTGFDRNTAVWN